LSGTPEYSFQGPWFSSREAQLYVCCKTLNAWYAWRHRHGVIARANGSVAKADLDRILSRRKPRRIMHPASLANLRKRRASRRRSAA
jgi:hypothetical protein